MLREYLGNSFDTYFRAGTNSKDASMMRNSEIGQYLHILSSSEILAVQNFGHQKEGHISTAFLYDVASEFRRLSRSGGKAEFGTDWPFPLLARLRNEQNKLRLYHPRSDFRLDIRGFPHCIMEVTSHEGGRRNNQSDQNQMFLQGSCLARLGNVLRKTSEPNSDPVVITAIIIDRELFAHEYLMYQPPSEAKKVLYHEEVFDLTQPIKHLNSFSSCTTWFQE
ncbi:hypothetical protein B0F90DRAFT_1274453 [Multifurca ochricompacta]|uniref:Uncharacterized protein n=1 Tax=Multifurca ochricompacta TaxID=376703 RepID=A0AAD4QHP0_9AGAM|nr:hypothetical protein B0F90DRAFT_1274453 [Multifurca ochricompacta]